MHCVVADKGCKRGNANINFFNLGIYKAEELC